MEGIRVVTKRKSQPRFTALSGTYCTQYGFNTYDDSIIRYCNDMHWDVQGVWEVAMLSVPCPTDSMFSRGKQYPSSTSEKRHIYTDLNGKRQPLLLASISSSRPEETVTSGRKKVFASDTKVSFRRGHDGVQTYALSIDELEKAKTELQKVAGFMGSVMLAGISKAMRHVEKSRRTLVNSSFSDSFSFPWKENTYRKERQKDGSEKLASNLASKGLDYERSLDVRAAVQCFEEAVKLNPDDLLCLCMAAKQWSDLTFYHDVETERERQVVNIKALEYAERAAELHPNSPGGHMAVCVAKGRLGLFMDNKTKVKLAKEAQEAAQLAIEVGPDNDVAHHLMGRWHYEMSKLNVVVRTIVRVMYGTQLSSGSKEEALKSYKKAIELAPGRLIHFVEAGRVLAELGHKDEARKYLETSLEKDIEDINAWQTRFDAEELLAQLNNMPWTRPPLVPPNVPANISGTSLTTAALLGVDDIHDQK